MLTSTLEKADGESSRSAEPTAKVLPAELRPEIQGSIAGHHREPAVSEQMDYDFSLLPPIAFLPTESDNGEFRALAVTAPLSFCVGQCYIPIRWRPFDYPDLAHQDFPRIKREGSQSLCWRGKL